MSLAAGLAEPGGRLGCRPGQVRQEAWLSNDVSRDRGSLKRSGTASCPLTPRLHPGITGCRSSCRTRVAFCATPLALIRQPLRYALGTKADWPRQSKRPPPNDHRPASVSRSKSLFARCRSELGSSKDTGPTVNDSGSWPKLVAPTSQLKGLSPGTGSRPGVAATNVVSGDCILRLVSSRKVTLAILKW